jgi:hypothetical protein
MLRISPSEFIPMTIGTSFLPSLVRFRSLREIGLIYTMYFQIRKSQIENDRSEQFAPHSTGQPMNQAEQIDKM